MSCVLFVFVNSVYTSMIQFVEEVVCLVARDSKYGVGMNATGIEITFWGEKDSRSRERGDFFFGLVNARVCLKCIAYLKFVYHSWIHSCHPLDQYMSFLRPKPHSSDPLSLFPTALSCSFLPRVLILFNPVFLLFSQTF